MHSNLYKGFEERGIMDERDVDYLEHTKVPEITGVDELAMEGIVRAVLHDGVTVYTDAYREMKGWFLGIESKRRYIEEICTDLIDWLKDKDYDNHNLDLDMGSFKTWMKTSENFVWRYYFLLNDGLWSKMQADLKSGRITDLEVIYDVSFKDRKNVAQELDSINNIKDLIKVVQKYIDRSNTFFNLIVTRKVKIKMAPFQVILLGAADLRRTCKKIVNLAL